MTQEDEQLLLQDLSARLFYGVKVDHFGTPREVIGIFSDIVQVGYDINDYEDTAIEDIKPYLRPMSSMTEEEKTTYKNYVSGITTGIDAANFMIWVYKHHLDIFHLIEKGLALEAPERMYNF